MLHLIPNLRRRWALRESPAGPLRDYLETPFPRPSADYRDLALLAVDIETTGLDPKRDDILSVGWVGVQRNRIDLGSACHRLVRTARAIPEASAVIHQITDDQAARGRSLDDVLAELLRKLAGKVMIAHHATMEKGFLGNACRRVYGIGLPTPIIDPEFGLRGILLLHIAQDPPSLVADDTSVAGGIIEHRGQHTPGDVGFRRPSRNDGRMVGVLSR